jgi:hypothetical protein
MGLEPIGTLIGWSLGLFFERDHYGNDDGGERERVESPPHPRAKDATL